MPTENDLGSENIQKQFSWSDPELLAHLYGGSKGVPADIYGESFSLKGGSIQRRDFNFWSVGPAIPTNCVFCSKNGGGLNDPALDLAQFDWRSMIKRAIQPIAYELPCLFYAQRPPKERRMEPSESYRLSELATAHACRNNMRSIWMMWEYDQQTCRNTNYYCISESCCWLFPLLGTGEQREKLGRQLQYFQQMSRALANTCRGKVYIMTDNITNVPASPYGLPAGDQEVEDWQGNPANPSIWLTHELPMLRELYKFGAISSFHTISPSGGAGYDLTIVLYYAEYPNKVPRVQLPPSLTRRSPGAGQNGSSEPVAWQMNMTAKEPQVIDPSMEITDYTREVWEMLRYTEQLKQEQLNMSEEERRKAHQMNDLVSRADSCSGAVAYEEYGRDWFG